MGCRFRSSVTGTGTVSMAAVMFRTPIMPKTQTGRVQPPTLQADVDAVRHQFVRQIDIIVDDEHRAHLSAHLEHRASALGEASPILSVHDVGAGGLSNALPELVHDAALGGKISLRKIPSSERVMSPREIWCNESQERYVLAIARDKLADFEASLRGRPTWNHVVRMYREHRA